MPAFIWGILYKHITDQYVEIGGIDQMIETKAEAQRDVLRRTVKNPFFFMYALYSTLVILSWVFSLNVAGLGDWYFSL